MIRVEAGSKDGARDLWRLSMTDHQIFAARECSGPEKLSPLFWSASPQGIPSSPRSILEKPHGISSDITRIGPGAKIGFGLIGAIRPVGYSERNVASVEFGRKKRKEQFL